jgi:hypothetical protein
MIHKEAAESLTHSVIRVLHSRFPSRFDCVDRHEHLFSMCFWLPCRTNQSENIWRGTHIALLWGVRMLDALVLVHIRFNVRCAIIFSVIWIISGHIPVKPIFSVLNAFRCAILLTFKWMMVDSPDSVDIEDLSSSSRKFLSRQR